MNSRLDKYYQNDTKVPSRQSRNKGLYNEIEEEKYNVNSNVSVLDDDGNNIDLIKLQNILDEKYKEDVSIKKIDYIDENDEIEYLDVTRDYDINSILEKAREHKETDYEVDRLKKARNEQFEILEKLNNHQVKYETDQSISRELTDLIEKINVNEKTSSNLLSDLLGNDDTSVVPPINDNLEADLEVVEEDKARIRKIEREKEIEETLSKSLLFNTDDFKELKKFGEDKKMSPFGIIFSILIIGSLLFGILYMLNEIFKWNLFS